MTGLFIFLSICVVCWTVRDIWLKVAPLESEAEKHEAYPDSPDAEALKRYMDRVDVLYMKAGLDAGSTRKD